MDRRVKGKQRRHWKEDLVDGTNTNTEMPNPQIKTIVETLLYTVNIFMVCGMNAVIILWME